MTVQEFAEKNVGKEFIWEEEYRCRVVGYDKSEKDSNCLTGIGVIVEMLEGEVGHNGDEDNFFLIEPSDSNNLRWVDVGEEIPWEPIEETNNKKEEKKEVMTEDNVKEAEKEALIKEYLERFTDIDRILINDDVTVIFLKNRFKAVVKRGKNEIADMRVGVLECLLKVKGYEEEARNLTGVIIQGDTYIKTFQDQSEYSIKFINSDNISRKQKLNALSGLTNNGGVKVGTYDLVGLSTARVHVKCLRRAPISFTFNGGGISFIGASFFQNT